MTVADRIRKTLLDRTGHTVTSAAQRLDIGRSALSNVLNGNAALSPELALKIEREFGLEARKLLIDQLVENLDALRTKR